VGSLPRKEKSMEDAFDKYPSIEIMTDAIDPVYKVRIMECVRDGRHVRFEKREVRVARKKLEAFVAELIATTKHYGK